MKRIVIFNHTAQRDWISGAEKSLIFLAKTLVRNKYQVMAVSPSSGMVTKQLQQLGVPMEIVPLTCFWEMLRPLPGFRQRLEQLKERDRDKLRLLYKTLYCFRPGYAAVNTVVNVWPAVVARNMGIPVVWFIREPIEESDAQKDAALLVSALSDQIVVTSRTVSRMFASYGEAKKVLYLPNVIDPGELQQDQWPHFRHKLRSSVGVRENQCLVGFVGSLSEEKGVDHFIEMAAHVRRLAPETVFCLAGTPGNPRFVSQIEQLSREGLPVHYLGYWDNINTLLPGLDVVVIPSVVSEGGPRTALEAMAFGIPIVAYRVGGLDEMVRHNKTGLLVPVHDRAALARCVLDLVQDGKKRIQFGQEARRVVETHYDLKSYEEKIKFIFQ